MRPDEMFFYKYFKNKSVSVTRKKKKKIESDNKLEEEIEEESELDDFADVRLCLSELII